MLARTRLAVASTALAVSGPASATVLYSTGFDTFAAGQQFNSASANYVGDLWNASTVAVTVQAGGGSRPVALSAPNVVELQNRTSADLARWVYRDITTEWAIRPAGENQFLGVANLWLGSSVNANAGWGLLVYSGAKVPIGYTFNAGTNGLNVFSDDAAIVYNPTNDVPTFTRGAWNQIALFLDYSTGFYDLALNGVHFATGSVAASVLAGGPTDLDMFNVTFSNASPQPGFFDNYSVSSLAPEPGIAGVAGFASFALVRRRKT